MFPKEGSLWLGEPKNEKVLVEAKESEPKCLKYRNLPAGGSGVAVEVDIVGGEG